ncbi:hypothetical protein D3C78_1458230 [compost metagenome]
MIARNNATSFKPKDRQEMWRLYSRNGEIFKDSGVDGVSYFLLASGASKYGAVFRVAKKACFNDNCRRIDMIQQIEGFPQLGIF